jgi:hypothetical protein
VETSLLEAFEVLNGGYEEYHFLGCNALGLHGVISRKIERFTLV